MKTYIVCVRDSDVADYDEYAIEVAKKALQNHKTAFAAIYAYQDANGQKVYFHQPLIKYSYNELQEFVKGLRNGKKATDKIVYAIYRNQLDE